MEPKIYIDNENDFASVKIKEGTEFKSYEKNGFIFCEDAEGNIIEIQILSLKELANLDSVA